jgi:two-component system phosphate regulon sensor histidine kinase PhoR
MFRRARQLDAPRRVVSIQLLFALLTVALLTAGIVQVVLTIQNRHVDASCLAMFGKATPLLRSDLRHNQGMRIQSIVEELARDYGLRSCAILDHENVYLAHSNRARVGETAPDVVGAVVQWGDVVRISFIDEDESPARMFRSPIRDGPETIAVLCAVAPERNFAGTVLQVLEHGAGPILLGVLCSAVGSVLLWRTLKPLSGVEEQLRLAAVAGADPAALRPVPATSMAAIGWNRLLQERLQRSSDQSIESKAAMGLTGHRERRAETVLGSLPDGVALTDPDGRIAYSNAALSAILGEPQERLLGRTMEELFSLADSPNGTKRFLDPQYRAQQVVAEIRRAGPQSETVLRLARVPAPSPRPDGPLAHVWDVRDVTQQKLADEMRNQFVYSATHELRTPLANIKAYAETLANAEVLDLDTQKQFCNTINLEASRLSRFIDDLLSISRMETGGLGLQKHETDAARLFEEAIAKVRPEMDAKQIELNVELPPKLPKIHVDKDKVTVTLVNLLGNAAKYTPEGGRVDFTVECAGDALLIHVVDTGIGIASEEVPKVFDKFFRSGDPRVQGRTGTGLGLAIANEIVRLHGGRISVHSELNKGSKFTVSLPIR